MIMDMKKDSIPFPEPFDPDFTWASEKEVLPKPEEVKPDFSWTREPDFDVKIVERNPHEIKDELAKQFGKDRLIPYTQENNSTQNVLKTASKKIIVQQVRTMMNQGLTPKAITARLAQFQKPEILSSCQTEIEKQFKLYGSVGRFILDARGYPSCSEALKTASKNPWRKYMTHVIGCKCGTPKTAFRVAGKANDIKESPTDGFGGVLEEKAPSVQEKISVCPLTGIQILGGEGDLDSQWAGDTMFSIIDAADLDPESGKKIMASDSSAYQGLKKFFIAMDESLIPQEKIKDVPVTEDYSVSGMEVQTNTDMPETDVDLNVPDNESISFLIPETQDQNFDINLQDSDTIKLNESPKEEVLDINRGIAPIELELQESEPVEMDLCQDSEDSICFELQEIPRDSLQVELGELTPEVEFNEDRDLDIGFEAGTKKENDIVL